jgi:alpha-tubulin suppressor-like RCC1 family protein
MKTLRIILNTGFLFVFGLSVASCAPSGPSVPQFLAITTGMDQTCALTAGGGVKCWGGNEFGQLGNGTTDHYSTPPVDVIGLTSGVSAISAGDVYTCALTAVGGVKCWGNHEYGQLGNGTTTYDSFFSNTAVDVRGLTSGVSDISTGRTHACALTIAGGVKCWGKNDYGQLGDGSEIDSSTPVDVSGLTSGVSAISAGGSHTCALTVRGGIMCWGDNKNGQLGNGTNRRADTPIEVDGLTSGVSAISAGGTHTCALTTDGGVKCWGENEFGELGNGATYFSMTPVDVIGLTSGVSAISAGGSHTCALTLRGAVMCWGNNGNGQLGQKASWRDKLLGTTPYRRVPVDASGLASGVSAISAGTFHTCALTAGSGVKCWGNNGNGQLGDGTTNERNTPVDVVELTAGSAP